ncbi:MAG TPA: acetylxylan esterase [Tepidisphaeraceae bacterium]
MSQLRWRVTGILLLLSSLAFAGAAPRVFEAGKLPDDARLHELHDVDHPVIFTPFTDRSAWEQRAKQLREQTLVAEGLWPLPPKTPLNPVIHGRIDRDDYTIEKVFFASYPGHYVSGNLYRPKNRTGKLPAVLCPHGHWPGGRFYERSDAEVQQQLREDAEKTENGARYPIQARCAMLARMGCVVFMYDMVGYADSTAIEHRAGFTDTEAILRLQSFMGLQTWNTMRALDFVMGLPDVDPSRIGVTGASGGGTQTILIAATDPRPSVVFPAVMVSESMQGGCICENAPLLRVGTNNVELIATYAPKPLGLSAANDWTVALDTDALPKLKSTYELLGAKDEVAGRHFSFEHNYNQWSRELMYNWFNQHLKLGWPSPVKEKPFDPVPPKELSVYDDQHPRPADTADAATLRKTMTRLSDQQLDDLFKANPDEYRNVVRVALRAMVTDGFPSPGDVTVSHSGGPEVKDGIRIETGALARRGTTEAAPFVSLVPADWNGTVLIWVHPDGKASLFDDTGKPTADVRRLLDAKLAVISADLFLTGEFVPGGKPAGIPTASGYSKQKYAGFYYGYNRGILANRVHDLLSEIAVVRGWTGTRKIDLVATGDVGPAALLARALAGDAIASAAIDLGGFDFDQVKADDDPMMLPGGRKYGGINGFVPLCASGETMLCGIRKSATFDRAQATKQVALREGPMRAADWIDSMTATGSR